MSSATTVEEAKCLDALGTDVIIAQGGEAGGHRGTFMSDSPNGAVEVQLGAFALVPQIDDAVGVPVIASGGSAEGRGIAAAFALGAAGVQIGTAFLGCPEASISPLYREARIRHAVLTNVFTGRVARARRSRLVTQTGLIAAWAPAFPRAMHATMQLAIAAQQRGDFDFTPFWAGQASLLGANCRPAG